MRRIYSSLLLSAFVVSAATASYQDDHGRHVTVVGERTIEHTSVAGAAVPEERLKIFDQRNPVDQQLGLRVLVNDIKWTCPAVPGTPDLENPREWTFPEYKHATDGTKVVLLNPDVPVCAVGKTFPVSPGMYLMRSIRTLKTDFNGDLKIETNQLELIGTLQDGLRVIIDFVETMHHIPFCLSLSNSIERRIAANAASSPIFTFSCWYRALPGNGNDTNSPLLSIDYAATEHGLEGKTKTMLLGMHLMGDNIALRYPLTEPGTRSIMIPEIIDVPGTKPKVIPASSRTKVVPWPAFTYPQIVDYLRTNKLPAGYSVKKTPMQTVNYTSCKAGLPRYRPAHHQVLLAAIKNTGTLSKKTAIPAKTIQVPTGKMVKKATGKQVSSTEEITVLSDGLVAAGAPVSGSWMNIVLTLDANTKHAIAYCNNKLLWEEIECPDLVHFHSACVNSGCTLKFGPHLANIAEVIIMFGKSDPNMFGCYNSRNQWVPKKFAGQLGPQGFTLTGDSSPTGL